MKILPMYQNAQGTYDLIHHTAKHFLDADEGPSWDLVPAGTLTATAARAAVSAGGPRPPPTGALGNTVDVRWWWPPWAALAREAHERGYRPRYELLLHLAPDPAGPAWETSSKDRRLLEYLGFRLVLEPRGEDYLVITAFFSRAFGGASKLPHLAPALRAFAARKNCPPGGIPGVSAPETKS